MVMPERPINFRPGDMSIDDAILLASLDGAMSMEFLADLKRIVAAASDWTEEEMGRVTITELARLIQMLQGERSALEIAAVPPLTGSS